MESLDLEELEAKITLIFGITRDYSLWERLEFESVRMIRIWVNRKC